MNVIAPAWSSFVFMLEIANPVSNPKALSAYGATRVVVDDSTSITVTAALSSEAKRGMRRSPPEPRGSVADPIRTHVHGHRDVQVSKGKSTASSPFVVNPILPLITTTSTSVPVKLPSHDQAFVQHPAVVGSSTNRPSSLRKWSPRPITTPTELFSAGHCHYKRVSVIPAFEGQLVV